LPQDSRILAPTMTIMTADQEPGQAIQSVHQTDALRLLGGHASKCRDLLPRTGRRVRILVHRRYDFRTLLASALAYPGRQFLGDLGTRFMLDGRGIVLIDLDGRTRREGNTKDK
jgi:hypothetical protein